MAKKRIAFAMCFIMLLSSIFQGTVFASFTDVTDDNPYMAAITTLSKLSVINGYEDGTFKPDGAITRAEFAKIIDVTLGYGEVEADDYGFTDISDHWAKNYINMCASIGIINGMGDGTFAPDSSVTYEQALKMTVCALGYGPEAEKSGGYPMGYQTEATTLGLTKGISDTAFTAAAPRGVIAQIVYNALEVDMANTDSSSTSVTSDSKNLLNDYLKTKKLKGTLVGVEDYTTEDCDEVLGNGIMDIEDTSGKEYLIDYTSYTTDVTQINSYLGKTITVYYSQPRSNSELTLVFIDDETTKNEVISINSADIDSYSGTQLQYYVGSKLKKIKLSPSDISLRYNGKLVSKTDSILLDNGTATSDVDFETAVSEWLDPDGDYFIYGDVKLTDSGADSDVDLIEIMDYKTIVAYKKPSSSDYRIQDKLNSSNYLILDPDSTEYNVTIEKDGKQITTTSIAANDVILYAKSLDGELYTVYDTAKTIKGEIQTIQESDNLITVDDKDYTMRDSCVDYIENIEGKTLKIGSTATFYLDKYDNIVFGTLSTESALPYAYIVSASYDESGESGKIIAYAPGTDSSAAKSFELANRVSVNGKSMSNVSVIELLRETDVNSNKDEDMADKIYGSGKTPTVADGGQVAKLKIESGKVTEIITLSDDTYDSDGNVTEGVVNDDTDKLVRSRSLSKLYYTSSSFKTSSSSASLFTTNSSTTVIFIPMDRTASNKTEYSKKTVSSAFTSGESYYVEAYDVNSSKIAGLILVYGTSSSLTEVKKTTDFSVVAEAPKASYNSETDETTQKVSVYRASNTATSWSTYDSSEFADVVPGDVIQFAYDNDKLIQGRINNIRFSDIADVLDNTDADVLYDWTTEQEPTSDNNYQSYLFDYRFKKSGTTTDETYTSTTLGTVPYSRAFVANVSQIVEDTNTIYVTKNGFTKDDNGDWVLDDTEYEEIPVGSAKIIRMETNRKEFSKYVDDDDETELTYTDLKDAKSYGTDCSKVLICTRAGATKLIVIYN